MASFPSEYVICDDVIASPPSRGYKAPLETASREPYTVKSARVGSEEKNAIKSTFRILQQTQTIIHRHLTSTAPLLFCPKAPCFLLKTAKELHNAQRRKSRASHIRLRMGFNGTLRLYMTPINGTSHYVKRQQSPQICGRTHRSAGCDNSCDVTPCMGACSIKAAGDAAQLTQGRTACRYIVYDIDVQLPCVSITPSVQTSFTLLAPTSICSSCHMQLCVNEFLLVSPA